jgi:hypothetical protein
LPVKGLIKRRYCIKTLVFVHVQPSQHVASLTVFCFVQKNYHKVTIII